MATAKPDISADFDLYPDVPKSWSLGFLINEKATPSGRSAGSCGWAGLANIYAWIDASHNIAAIYATQVLPFLDPQTHAAYEVFESALYDHLS